MAALAADERQEMLEERAFRDAAALAAPSLVRIDTVGGLDVVGKMLAGSGPTTGVVVGEEGWIITSSFNFAQKPASILVTTADGRRHPAEVIASDEARMLTLLKIDASGLRPLPHVPQSELKVGQWSIALGLTYDPSFPNVSVGIVSALGRIWGRAIQTDAKVSPANYGGPLLDVQGRGMGILVPLSPEQTGQTAGVEWYDSGIGFAIPLQDVYSVLKRMQQGEDLSPGLMGINFADRGPIAGEAVIDRVRPGSPADEAGLQVGDRIIEADGQPIQRVPHLRHVLGRKYAGDELSLKISRDDKTVSTIVRLAAELTAYERPLLGILPERTPAGSESPSGVTARYVLPDSAAARAGLERSDRIVAVNGTPVRQSKELFDAIGHHRPDDVVSVSVKRDDQSIEIEVELAAMSGSLPDALPTAVIPAPDAEQDKNIQMGRIVQTLGGDEDRKYWAYVPQSYNARYAYGLIVWLHPAGDTQESETLKAWRRHCERRGCILAAPKTSRPEGWTPADVDFVTDLVESLQERYTIDPTRIVLHAAGNAADMAAATAFRRREMFRGLSLLSAPLRVPPPETDPEAPLHFHFAFAPENPSADAIEEAIAALQQLKFPVTQTVLEASDLRELNADAADAIARWIDALDRI